MPRSKPIYVYNESLELTHVFSSLRDASLSLTNIDDTRSLRRWTDTGKLYRWRWYIYSRWFDAKTLKHARSLGENAALELAKQSWPVKRNSPIYIYDDKLNLIKITKTIKEAASHFNVSKQRVCDSLFRNKKFVLKELDKKSVYHFTQRPMQINASEVGQKSSDLVPGENRLTNECPPSITKGDGSRAMPIDLENISESSSNIGGAATTENYSLDNRTILDDAGDIIAVFPEVENMPSASFETDTVYIEDYRLNMSRKSAASEEYEISDSEMWNDHGSKEFGNTNADSELPTSLTISDFGDATTTSASETLIPLPLPEPEFLDSIRYFTSNHFTYDNPRPDIFERMDETALLTMSILMQECTRFNVMNSQHQ